MSNITNSKKRPISQTELENLAKKKFRDLPGYDDDETTFHPLTMVVYRRNNVAADMAAYAEKAFCEPPALPVSIESMKKDIAGFMDLYRIGSDKAGAVAQTAGRVQRSLDIPEVYALAIAFVVETAAVARNEEAMRDLAFLCARHMGESYTQMVLALLDFNRWKPVLSDAARGIFELYLDVLQSEFAGTIPLKWLHNYTNNDYK